MDCINTDTVCSSNSSNMHSYRARWMVVDQPLLGDTSSSSPSDAFANVRVAPQGLHLEASNGLLLVLPWRLVHTNKIAKGGSSEGRQLASMKKDPPSPTSTIQGPKESPPAVDEAAHSLTLSLKDILLQLPSLSELQKLKDEIQNQQGQPPPQHETKNHNSDSSNGHLNPNKKATDPTAIAKSFISVPDCGSVKSRKSRNQNRNAYGKQQRRQKERGEANNAASAATASAATASVTVEEMNENEECMMQILREAQKQRAEHEATAAASTTTEGDCSRVFRNAGVVGSHAGAAEEKKIDEDGCMIRILQEAHKQRAEHEASAAATNGDSHVVRNICVAGSHLASEEHKMDVEECMMRILQEARKQRASHEATAAVTDACVVGSTVPLVGQSISVPGSTMPPLRNSVSAFSNLSTHTGMGDEDSQEVAALHSSFALSRTSIRSSAASLRSSGASLVSLTSLIIDENTEDIPDRRSALADSRSQASGAFSVCGNSIQRLSGVFDPESDVSIDNSSSSSSDDEEEDQRSFSALSIAETSQCDLLVEATLVPTDDIEQQQQQNDEMPMEIFHAKPFNHLYSNRYAKLGIVMFILLVLCFVFVQVYVGVIPRLPGAEPSESSTDAPTTSPTATPLPMLQRVRERQTLKCGILSTSIAFYGMLDERKQQGLPIPEGLPPGDGAVALCRALAAAAIGPEYTLELVGVTLDTGLEHLANGTADIIMQEPTPTVERDVFEETNSMGFSYSIPYFFDGLKFAGLPFATACADDDIKTFFECSDIRICSIQGLSYHEFLARRVPGRNILSVPDLQEAYMAFTRGDCNVMAIQGITTGEPVIRAFGYEGEYAVGRNLFTRDGLSMAVLDDDDSEWIDFVNSVLLALFAAEEKGITKTSNETFVAQSLFGSGDEYKDMFQNALAASGNYGEIYETYWEPVVPRATSWNRLNNGTSGLIKARALESTLHRGPGPVEGGSLERILRRGLLRCAVRPNRTGFAIYDPETSSLSGMDVDYCYAIAASLFNGEYGFVDFVEVLDETDGFKKLAQDKVDVFAGATWTAQNDFRESRTGIGYTLTTPYFYRPEGYGDDDRFNDNLCMATRQEDSQFASFVYWTIMATLSAESDGISQRLANELPLVSLFGPKFERMFRDAVHAVGNRAAIYNRHVASHIPLSGRNILISVKDISPLIYVVPGFFEKADG